MEDSRKFDKFLLSGDRIPSTVLKTVPGHAGVVTEDAVKFVVCSLLDVITAPSREWTKDICNVFLEPRRRGETLPDIPSDFTARELEVLNHLLDTYNDAEKSKTPGRDDVDPSWALGFATKVVSIKGPQVTEENLRKDNLPNKVIGYPSDMSEITVELFVRRDPTTNECTKRDVMVRELEAMAAFVTARRAGLGMNLQVPEVFQSFLADEASIRIWWWGVWAEFCYSELHKFGGPIYLVYDFDE